MIFCFIQLFTSIPEDDAVRAMKSRMENDDTLSEGTDWSPDTICDLLKFCQEKNLLHFQDEFYEQTNGAAMLSPVSPVVVILYIELDALETAPTNKP